MEVWTVSTMTGLAGCTGAGIGFTTAMEVERAASTDSVICGVKMDRICWTISAVLREDELELEDELLLEEEDWLLEDSC